MIWIKAKVIKKQDVVLIVVLLGIGLFTYWMVSWKKEKGTHVAVYVSGEKTTEFSLEQDTEYLIKTSEGSNWLMIEDNKAYIKEADCKDEICVSHAAINREGETIVCLPHKVVVQVEKGEEREIDGISQ